MTIIGVDPGLGGTGVAIKQDGELVLHKVIRCTNKNLSWPVRAKLIAEDFSDMIAPYLTTLNNSPENKATIIIELPENNFRSKAGVAATNSGAVVKLSYLCGMLVGSVETDAALTVELISPARWKGQLGKHVVLARLLRQYGIKFKDHEADAVGMLTSYENGWRLK